MTRASLALLVITLVPAASAQSRSGQVVVNGDEWTLSDSGYAAAPQGADQFARNVAAAFAPGGAGRFLVYSQNFGLTGTSLAGTMANAGHAWTLDTNVPFTVAALQAYHGVFVCGQVNGQSVDNQVLIDYVRGGGSVYVAGGTGNWGGQADLEAAAWNPLLHWFGLGFDNTWNLGSRLVPVGSAHPLLAGVPSLMFYGSNNVVDVAPQHAGSQVLVDPDLGVSSVASADLQLAAAPNPVAPNQTLTFTLSGGLPGWPMAFAIDSVNGAPFPPVVLFFGTLDGAGTWRLPLLVPAGLSGLSLGFLAASFNEPMTALLLSPRTTVGFL